MKLVDVTHNVHDYVFAIIGNVPIFIILRSTWEPVGENVVNSVRYNIMNKSFTEKKLSDAYQILIS